MELFIFTDLQKDKVIKNLIKFKESGDEKAYYKVMRKLIKHSEKRFGIGEYIREYIVRTMLEQDNLPDFERARAFLRLDAKTIYYELLSTDWDACCEKYGQLPFSVINGPTAEHGLTTYTSSLSGLMYPTSAEAFIGSLIAHAEVFGTGKTSSYAALRWENGKLRGILNTDPITFGDLVGLEHQKKVLISNTESFLKGLPANDVLLTGSSGTGKSSCVKACLNMFKGDGLRLIELRKSSLGDLGRVLKSINNKMLKYIIFIDDLSFEPDDPSYKELKVALDGQAETRDSNVLIYATSNRRRLIKETWTDREGGDEIHRSEALSERKSLADRFGINLSFITPTQKEYLNIVASILARHNIDMTEEIKSDALTWQIQYNGFSGRTAEQFAAHVLSSI